MSVSPATRLMIMLLVSAPLAGCLGKPYASRGASADVTGSIGTTVPSSSGYAAMDGYAARYRANPDDVANAVAYAHALRATSQAPQAVAVLQRVTLKHRNDMGLLGEYGRALADAGEHNQALDVLSRSHRADQPDWRIYNVMGTVYDAKGMPDEAQRYYDRALKIAPGEPSILSNLGLSQALGRNLRGAEQTLRTASRDPRASSRVKQNLALVVGLQGRFNEAEQIARAELPPDQAQANVTYLRQLLAQPNNWARLKGPNSQSTASHGGNAGASQNAAADVINNAPPMRPASLPTQRAPQVD